MKNKIRLFISLLGVVLLVGLGLFVQRQFFPYCPLVDAAAEANWNKVLTLLDQGADANQTDERDQTALMYAAICNRPDVVKRLLAKGADPTCQDNDGSTALSWAMSPNKPINPEVIVLLRQAMRKK